MEVLQAVKGDQEGQKENAAVEIADVVRNLTINHNFILTTN